MNCTQVRLAGAMASVLITLTAGAQGIYYEQQTQNSIYVSGSAEIKVVPDRIEIAVGVETAGRELRAAKKENDAAIARVIAAAKQHGIEAGKVQTDFLSIEPRYDHNQHSRPIIGYVVRKSMVIESTDLDGFEELMSAVVDAGANHVHNIRFLTTELRRHRDEARKMAARAATEKAQLIATSLGRKLGSARNVSESSDNWSSSYGSWWDRRGANPYAQNVNVAASSGPSGSADGTFAPGRISVTASVTVTFALE